MANVLTALAPDIYRAADVVGREMVGFLPSVVINANADERVAIGQPVRSFFTRQATAVDITPSMIIPEGADQTIDNKTLALSKQRGVEIPWTGEDIKYVDAGAGFRTIYGDQIRQAMRTLANEMEADLASEVAANASRAVGTAGTTPFAANFNALALVRKVLVDNGAPVTDGRLSLVMDTLAGANLRSLAQLQKANEAGGTNLLRQGELLNLMGFMLKESAQVATHTAGTGAGYLVNHSGGYAAKSTVIAVDTGTGTILAGDTITFAGDPNAYVVTSALTAGTLTIGSPGLRTAVADNTAVTVGTSFTAHAAFHQSAVEFVVRPPALPPGGDAARERMVVQDPWSGITFDVAMYVGFQKAMFMVSAVWGQKAWKPDFITLLMG